MPGNFRNAMIMFLIATLNLKNKSVCPHLK